MTGGRFRSESVRPDRPFRLLRTVGENTFGSVWEAEGRDPGSRVTVEFLLDTPPQDHGLGDRLRRAMAIQPSLPHHPNILAVVDACSDDRAQWYILMEAFRGMPLTTRIGWDERLGLADAIRVGREVADAMDVVHAAGRVHGALDVDHVLITEYGRAKVINFGLAGVGLASIHLGSPGWAQPDSPPGDHASQRGEQERDERDLLRLVALVLGGARSAKDLAWWGAILWLRRIGSSARDVDALTELLTRGQDVESGPPTAAETASVLRSLERGRAQAVLGAKAVEDRKLPEARPTVPRDRPEERGPTLRELASASSDRSSTPSRGTRPVASSPYASTAPPDLPPESGRPVPSAPGVAAASHSFPAARPRASDRSSTTWRAIVIGVPAALILFLSALAWALALATNGGSSGEGNGLGVGASSTASASASAAPTVEVPAVTGMVPSRAHEHVVAAGIVVEGVRPQPGPPGVVIGSLPAAGTAIPEGSGITLLIGVESDRLPGS